MGIMISNEKYPVENYFYIPFDILNLKRSMQYFLLFVLTLKKNIKSQVNLVKIF